MNKTRIHRRVGDRMHAYKTTYAATASMPARPLVCLMHLLCDNGEEDGEERHNHNDPRAPGYRTECESSTDDANNQLKHAQAPDRFSGTVMTRTVLSALPEMSRLAEGLNRSVVGGNSCAFRMVSSG